MDCLFGGFQSVHPLRRPCLRPRDKAARPVHSQRGTSEWPAGKTTQVALWGTGFVCQGAPQVTDMTIMPSNQGSIFEASPMNIIGPGEITFTATPNSSDPTQPVTIDLYPNPPPLPWSRKDKRFELRDRFQRRACSRRWITNERYSLTIRDHKFWNSGCGGNSGNHKRDQADTHTARLNDGSSDWDA